MKELEFKTRCPNCGHQFHIKVKEMVPGRTKNCPHCQPEITFTGDDGRRAQKAFDELQKTLKKAKVHKVKTKL